MHRKEYDEALAILTKGRYPTSDWDGGYEIQAAKELEKRYPEETLKYYLSGLGNLKDRQKSTGPLSLHDQDPFFLEAVEFGGEGKIEAAMPGTPLVLGGLLLASWGPTVSRA